MTYYKAVRPDGMSFNGDPRVSYTRKDGSPRTSIIRPAPYEGTPRLCGPGMLHVSDTPAETLLGGSWPCRLFEVAPVGPVLASDRHKHGVDGLRIVAELAATRALGPQGAEVAAVIERARTLTRSEAEALDAARDATWDAARDATRDAALDAALDAAWYAAWYAARYAARYAATALVVRDLISTEHYDALSGPWRRVVGPIHPDDPDIKESHR